MELSPTEGRIAWKTEERYRTSVHDAVMDVLGTSPERVAYFEAALDNFWEYGEQSPFAVAAEALQEGDMDLYEHAMADDARITALADEMDSVK